MGYSRNLWACFNSARQYEGNKIHIKNKSRWVLWRRDTVYTKSSSVYLALHDTAVYLQPDQKLKQNLCTHWWTARNNTPGMPLSCVSCAKLLSLRAAQSLTFRRHYPAPLYHWMLKSTSSACYVWKNRNKHNFSRVLCSPYTNRR